MTNESINDNESNVIVIRQPNAYITINKNSTAIRKASSSKQKRKRNSNHCYCRSPTKTIVNKQRKKRNHKHMYNKSAKLKFRRHNNTQT